MMLVAFCFALIALAVIVAMQVAFKLVLQSSHESTSSGNRGGME